VKFWHNEHHMNPMFPRIDEELESLVIKLVSTAGELRGSLHPYTRQAVSGVVEQMNCYYSNLIEGHYTLPLDIERALADDYSADPGKRNLQIEAKAHVEVQRLIKQRLGLEPVNVLSAEFLKWVHGEFYRRLPDEMLVVTSKSGKSRRVVPGRMREEEVEVGVHVALMWKTLDRLLEYFTKQYDVERLTARQKIVALGAAHHRILWLHPFLDGNGRVARLMTDAYLRRLGLDADGLWTPSRGLARQNDAYKQRLAAADAQRRNDLDGRGNLSEHALRDFCKFFLKICVDQTMYMKRQLDIGGLAQRIDTYVKFRVAEGTIRGEATRILQDVLMRGEIARGDAERASGLKERTSRTLLSQLLQEGLLVSDSPKGKLRIGFPSMVREFYFPRLFQTPVPGEEEVLSFDGSSNDWPHP
jgi:Fic family protein